MTIFGRGPALKSEDNEMEILSWATSVKIKLNADQQIGRKNEQRSDEHFPNINAVFKKRWCG